MTSVKAQNVLLPAQRQFRFSLSIGWFFAELPIAERFARAHGAGFGAVEMFWPGDSAAALREAQAATGLDVALLNMDEGDYASGERGYACDPAKREQWRQALDRALELAATLSCRRVTVLTGDVPASATRSECVECLTGNLTWALPRARACGVTLLLEPLNRASHQRYLCQRTADVVDVLQELDDANLKLQYDIYHAQRSEGNLIETIRNVHKWIGHVQVADVPTRGRPGTGEVNFGNVFDALAEVGYDGFVGLEYDPSVSSDPLAWIPRSERS